VLRTERGLTYGASADMNGMKETGDIVAETNTRSQTTGETLRLMVDEFWRLIRDRVNDRELEGAQEYLTGSFPLTIETPSQIALQVLNAVFYGLNLNELQTYRERVNAVTVDDVQRVAREYLHPDRLTIVLVGDASSFVNQLAGAGFDRFERIPLMELDLSSADLRRRPAAQIGGGFVPAAYHPAGQSKADVAPTAANEPRALIAKAVDAKGGLAKLQQVQTLRAEATATVHTAEGEGTISTVTFIQYPDRYRQEMQTPQGRVVQVYADGRYWIEDARGVRDAPLSARDEIHESVQRDVTSLLLRASDGKLTLSDADSGDDRLAAVSVSSHGMRPVTLFIDRATGLVVRERYEAPDGGGVVEEQYSDYRPVDGLQVPFRTVLTRQGTPIIERVITSVRFNVPLQPSLFLRPS
jgi:outer membrane lipoprotein-sorting protein